MPIGGEIHASRLRPGFLVDPSNPVNWAHPLNYGRVGWWRRVPGSGSWGGLRVKNLVRVPSSRFDVSIVNATSPVQDMWRRLAPPGGFGSIRFTAASNQYAEVAALPVTSTPCSLLCWAYLVSATTSYDLVWMSNSGGSVAHFIGISTTTNGECRAEDSGPTGDVFANSTGTFAANTWTHFAGVFPTDSLQIAYVNAGGKGTNTQAAGSPWADLNVFDFGALNNGGVGPFGPVDGWMDGVSVYNVTLGDDLVMASMQDDLAGNPETLNWMSTKAYSFPSAAAGVSPWGWDETESVAARLKRWDSIQVIPRAMN